MSEVMPERQLRSSVPKDPWSDDDDPPIPRPLTADEARAVLADQPRVSPWRVVAVQVFVGMVLAAIAGLTSAGPSGAASVMWGMLVVVVPAALMARGMTSRLSLASPGLSAVSFMWWELVKILVSVLMLALAPRVVQPLNWVLMLLAALVCMKVYWVALLWRGSRKH